MGRLENKHAVVTGATSGIGRAVAVMFAKEGAEVVATGRSAEKGEALVKEIEAAGGTVHFISANLRDKADIKKVYDFAMEKMGKVDVLFNCAGVLVHKPYLEQTDEDLQLVFETNFRADSWMMQQFIPEMVEIGGGSIVNVASISSIWPELNSYYYGAMKAAVSNLSRNVAKEFAPKKVRVNCLLPGPIMTGMTPEAITQNPEALAAFEDSMCLLGRIGVPDDIAYGAVYLASDETAFMTGQQIAIDGGVCVSN